MHDDSQQTLQDFVFGGVEADPSQRLAAEQARWQGVRHEHRIHPGDPPPGQPVTLTVSVGPDAPIDRLCAYVTTDGSRPDGSRGTASNGQAVPLARTAVKWQPLLWDFVELWEGTLPAQPEGTLVQYRLEGWHTAALEAPSHWSRELAMDGIAAVSTLYGYHVDRFTPPEWARDAVVYQVFVDRFARGPQGEAVAAGWLAAEELEQFVGGDLAGVTARLEYIAGLGVSALWLSPIFRAHSYHAYDTVDFQEIDPRFGTKDDLARLVAKAHRLGLRVILDFVANHTSDRATFFRQAQADANSPQRDWFSFGPDYTHGYRTFFDVKSMPQFATDSRGARDYLISSARYWLEEFRVDGFRLDYAAGPSHAFWSEFAAACRKARPDCWLFGEVTRTGDALRAYAGRLDGCLDFDLLRRLRMLCAGPQPTIALSDFARFVEHSQQFYPPDFSLPAFVDNHDTNRFLWVAGNEPARLRLALGLLFGCGGPPILYYGTEVGLSQPRAKGPWREESRHPMRWGNGQDQALLAYTRALIRLRRSSPALCRGDVRTLAVDDGRQVWLAERRWEDSRVLLAVNAGVSPQELALPRSARWNLLEDQPLHGRSIALPPRTVAFLE